VFGEYVLYALNREPSQFEGKILGLGLLTTTIIIHSCFLKTGILIQNVLGWVKIALAVFMVFTSLYVVIFRSNEGTQSASKTKTNSSFLWEGSVWNWGIISTAMFKVSYSYAGLSNVNNVLNEVKNPVKTLKSAATTALITSCILYLLVNIAYFLVVPIEEIKDSGELIAALFFERVFGAELGRVLLPLAIATSAAGNVMVVTFSHVSLVKHYSAKCFLTYTGSSCARDCTTRISTIFTVYLLLKTIWSTDGRSHYALHPFFLSYQYSCGQHIFLYPRRRGLSRAVLLYS
jgi:amino acid transporter